MKTAASFALAGDAEIALGMTKAQVLDQLAASRRAPDGRPYIGEDPSQTQQRKNIWRISCSAPHSELLGGGSGVLLSVAFRNGRVHRIELWPWPAGSSAIRAEPPSMASPHGGLKCGLRTDGRPVAAGSTTQALLSVQAAQAVADPPKLLRGRFVFVMVPIGGDPQAPAVATVHRFSGGGGIDYTGKNPMVFKVAVPDRSGPYLLVATVISTDEDVRWFLKTTRLGPGAGPWWRGVMARAPVRVTVTDIR
ncbi:MAG: hypothetical protein R3236_04305 [Phycisphaeraceae bacterium]|nr:hypothetical protein [Phycisphaeraceae bacterium]